MPSDPGGDPPATAQARAASTISTADRPAQTEYVVLERVLKATEGWQEVARIGGSSSTQAIEKHRAKVGREPTVDATFGYVAVPVRSWQPLQPKTETVTTTKLEAIA